MISICRNTSVPEQDKLNSFCGSDAEQKDTDKEHYANSLSSSIAASLRDFDIRQHEREKECSSAEVKVLLERRISELEIEKIRAENCALLERIGMIEGEKTSLISAVSRNMETNDRLVGEIGALNEKIHGLFREIINKDAEEKAIAVKYEKVCADLTAAGKTIQQLSREKENVEEPFKLKLCKAELDLQNVIKENHQEKLKLEKEHESSMGALKLENCELQRRMAKTKLRLRIPPGVYFLRCAVSHGKKYLAENGANGHLVVSAEKKTRFKLAYVSPDDEECVFTLFSIDADKMVSWKDYVGVGSFDAKVTVGATDAHFEADEIDSQGVLTLQMANYMGKPPLWIGLNDGLWVLKTKSGGTKFCLEPTFCVEPLE